MLKYWRHVAVVIAFILSVLTLFQMAPKKTVEDWQRMAGLSPSEITKEVHDRVEKMPGWDKMNLYQKEHTLKAELDKAQMANNIQVLGHFKNPFANSEDYVIYTSLKLGLDLRGGCQLLLRANPSPQVPEINSQVMAGVETVINNRINSLGVAETVVQRAGKDRLIVELPGIKDPQQAKDRIGTTALLEFKELAHDAEGRPVWKDVGLTGADFKHAQATPMMASGGAWRVNFEFKDAGARKFAELTKRLIHQQIGIFLDGQPTDRGPDGRPLPIEEYRGVTVREPILGGTGEITGSFTKEQAVDLAVKLNAGALPVPITILEERTVGATLGQDSIEKSLVAGGIGILTVMCFMLLIYGLPGLVADIALILYALATLAIFVAMPVTLTLAGIAGFILSIGMAVDANILIFERTKEELKAGKTLYLAIEAGFNKAFSAIWDSNANSMIACCVLMMFGTSIVKGFAVTLAIGVAVSMFTAITATRTLLHLVPRQVGLFGHKYDRRSQMKQKEAV